MRYLITLSYDGTNYKGYQTQPGLLTIQEQIENALTKINDGKKTLFISSGRTDRGVHAKMQCGHADIDVNITEYKLKRAMNSNLPNDIHVIKTEKVNNDFHARYNVIEKTYEYYINIGEYNPIERNYVFQYNYPLNIEKMQRAITDFLGTHDFSAFCASGSSVEDKVRTVYEANIRQDEENGELVFTFRGDGFLYKMIRIMVGTLLKIGNERMSVDAIPAIIASKDRNQAGPTAHPEGLYLKRVKYE